MLCLFFGVSYSFQSQIKGNVIDGKNGDPIPGASVILSTEQKIKTNISGDFELSPSAYPIWIYIK